MPRLEHSAVQSVYFPDTEWRLKDAIAWIARHHAKPLKMTHEGGNYRFRLQLPYKFSHFITKRGLHDGHTVYFVIGFY